MIESTQKVIKIGSSGGVTIPAKDLKSQGVSFGDEIKLKWEPVKKNGQEKLMKEYEQFVKEYGQTLKNLSDR